MWFAEHPFLTSAGAVLLGGLDGAAILSLVYRSRGVEATLAWLFAVLALPGIGAISYFLLADPRVKRTTKRRRQACAGVRDAEVVLADPTDASPLFAVAAGITGLCPTAGNRVEVLNEDEHAFERLEAALHEATCRIHAEYFLIRRDATGQRFLELLADRARDGLEVRLIYDAVGSFRFDRALLNAIHTEGGRCVPFHPLNPLASRWAIHLRNHRKLVIVDGAVGFTGGMNVGDEYSGRARRRGQVHFRDTHARLEGPCVQALEQAFAEDWAFATDEPLLEAEGPPPAEVGESTVCVVPSGPDQPHNASRFVYLTGISQARRRVWLSSPYFAPEEPTLTALYAAALRGVDVRVVIPREGDVAVVGPAARSFCPGLIEAGVRVFEYLPSMLHAKTMVVDDRWALVGSANFDIRSFRLNFELGVLVEDTAVAAHLAGRFEEEFRQSEELTAERVGAWSTWRRLGQGAARLLVPLL